MKRTFFTLMIAVICFAAKAQSAHTLAFSRALILTNGTTYTVPSSPACVWKVVGAVYNASNATNLFYNGSTTGSYAPTLQITPPGGSATNVSYQGLAVNFNYDYDMVSYGEPNFIMWLPAGTQIEPTGATSMVSVVEFVVQ